VDGAGVVVVDPNRPPAAYSIRKKLRRNISNTTP